MTDSPTEQPVEPRRDPGAADLETQVDLGWVDPPPEPEPAPVEPPAPADQDESPS